MTTKIGRLAPVALSLALAASLGACDRGSTESPRPDPPPPPSSPAADPGGAFGVFAAFAPEFSTFWVAMGMDFAAYQDWAGARMQDLGATWTRSNLQLVWDLVEPVPGAGFDWTASLEGERTWAAASAHGVHYLAVFHEGGGGKDGKPALRDPLADLDGYARFVQSAVERYDGDGGPEDAPGIVIRHWQVGNETMNWLGTGRTPEDYVTWFAATAAAIRSADPGARVALVASTNGHAVDPFHANVIPALAALGVTIDVVDVHHWDRADLASSTMDAVPAYRTLLDGAGMTAAEIWSCEHGTYVGMPVPRLRTCPTACDTASVCSPLGTCVPRCASDASCPSHHPFCEPTTGLCTDQPAQDHAEQARSLVYRYVVNRQLGVRRILWNNLASFRCFGGNCGDFFDRIGLVADGFGPGETAADVGQPRRAYHTYRLLAARTEEAVATPDGAVDAGDPAVHAYAYLVKATGKRALVAWADSTTSAALPFEGATADVTGLLTDAAGAPLRSEQIAAVAGQLVVALDPDPVWIEEAP